MEVRNAAAVILSDLCIDGGHENDVKKIKFGHTP